VISVIERICVVPVSHSPAAVSAIGAVEAVAVIAHNASANLLRLGNTGSTRIPPRAFTAEFAFVEPSHGLCHLIETQRLSALILTSTKRRVCFAWSAATAIAAA
jgi:hypothetical protein